MRDFKRGTSRADGATAQLSGEQFFAAPVSGDNSVAVTVKRVGGNLVSRRTHFLTSDGDVPRSLIGTRRDMSQTPDKALAPARDATTRLFSFGKKL